MKRHVFNILFLTLAIGLSMVFPNLSFAKTDIPIEARINLWDYNGIIIATGEAENNRVFVPMRIIFETFDATVDWQQSTKTITAKRCDGAIIKMTLDSNTASITQNNETTNITMDVAPKVESGKTMVPLRFVAENLMCDVQWAEKEKKVIITKQYITNSIENSSYMLNLKTEEFYAQLDGRNFELIGLIKGIENYYDPIGDSYLSSIQKVEKTPGGNYMITVSIEVIDSRLMRQILAYINIEQQTSNLVLSDQLEWGDVNYNYYVNKTDIWLPGEKQVIKLDDITGKTIAIYDYKNILEKALAINPFLDISAIDSIGFDFCDDNYILLSYTKKTTFNTKYFVLVNLTTNEPVDLIAELIPVEDIGDFIREDHTSPSNQLEFNSADNNILYFDYVQYDDLWQSVSTPVAYWYK